MLVPYTSSLVHINLLFENLNEYRCSGLYCDLRFVVDGQEFACHRVIVASSSTYFQALLTHPFKETHLDSIELHDVQPQIFSLLLCYVYSGHIDIGDHNVYDLLIASNMFQLEEVAQFCCHYLSISLNEGNVLETWKLAHELDRCSLQADAEQYLLTHFRELIRRDVLQQFPRSLLIQLISNDELIVDNEQQVLEAILIWYASNHEQPVEQLFDKVRLEYISKEHQNVILQQIGFVRIARSSSEVHPHLPHHLDGRERHRSY